MSDIASEMGTYIATNLGYTLGTDLFVGQMPTGTDKGVFIVRTGGILNNYVQIQTTFLEIFYKDSSAKTAIAKLETMKNFLHRMIDTQTANNVIYTILAVGDIEDAGRDLESNQLYSLTIEVTHRPTSLIS